jgi:hypothetical protein
MFYKFLAFSYLFFSIHGHAFSSLTCRGPQKISYSFKNLTGGAHPFPGMITHLEVIENGPEVIFRKVHREPCSLNDLCQVQQPEMVDIDVNQLPFHFVEGTKQILASEGQESGPYMKETYAIKFFFGGEIWLLCESSMTLYP